VDALRTGWIRAGRGIWHRSVNRDDNPAEFWFAVMPRARRNQGQSRIEVSALLSEAGGELFWGGDLRGTMKENSPVFRLAGFSDCFLAADDSGEKADCHDQLEPAAHGGNLANRDGVCYSVAELAAEEGLAAGIYFMNVATIYGLERS
jgi:hypothetical protein